MIFSCEGGKALAKIGVGFGIKIRVGIMKKPCGLFLDDLGDRRMIVSEVIDGDTGGKVEVAVTINVPYETTVAAVGDKIKGGFGVRVCHILRMVIKNCFRTRSGRWSVDQWIVFARHRSNSIQIFL